VDYIGFQIREKQGVSYSETVIFQVENFVPVFFLPSFCFSSSPLPCSFPSVVRYCLFMNGLVIAGYNDQ